MNNLFPKSVPDAEAIARAESLTALVQTHADYADSERRLHPDVSAAFAKAGLYRLAAPATVGGTDANALTQVAVLETVAQADASSGWNLMIGIETFGLVAPSMSDCTELLADPLRVMASSTAAVGRAEREEQGWRVTGRWQFVSGVHNATLFGATVQLYDQGKLLQPEPCYALIRGTGLSDRRHLAQRWLTRLWLTRCDRSRGTDSRAANCLAASRQPKGRSANLRFPRGARLAYNKAAVALGIVRAGLDAFTTLALGKHPRFFFDITA